MIDVAEKTYYSLEYLQDIEIQMRLLGKFRTTDITEEEIAVWKDIYFGPKIEEHEEFIQTEECRTWRDFLGCTGPAHRSPILTGEITDQEMQEWKVEYEKLKNINFAEVRKKYNVKFETDEDPPYKEYESSSAWDQWFRDMSIDKWLL